MIGGYSPSPLSSCPATMTEAQSHFLGNNPLNRLSFLRDHAAFVNAAAAHSDAKWMLFRAGGQPLVRTMHAQRKTNLALLPTSAIAHLIGPAPLFGQGQHEGESFDIPEGQKIPSIEAARLRGLGIVFLGVLEQTTNDTIPSKDNNWQIDGAPYFALDVQHASETELEVLVKQLTTEEAETEFVDPFATMGDFEPTEAALFAVGRSMWDWNSRRKFCPACGSPVYSLWAGWKLGCSTLVPWADNGDKAPCLSGKGLHNFTHPRTDIAIITAVINEKGDKILLGRNKRFPLPMYSTLAGFIEPAESFEDAVKREIWEEAGVKVHNVRYHSGQPWPFPANLMVGCYATADDSQPIRTDLDAELADARWFTRDEILRIISHPKGMIIRKREYKKFSDHIEGRVDAKDGENVTVGHALAPESDAATNTQTKARRASSAQDDPPFRIPPLTAIAGVLISNWAKGIEGVAKL
ncbi:NUDIX hydrolase domain-like protein [Auriculariales sp. MPI-PUGE-AT-0066]|nr:NUDIX hydrolase domain-like protein [Auriculariales sp. MPI-PUGE-AT-0066]